MTDTDRLIELDVSMSIWERFFRVSPLVVIGSEDPDGNMNLAVKTLAMPLGWENHYAFVCTPTHATYSNVGRTGWFTVSYPEPGALVEASLTSSPREETKPILGLLPTVAATKVPGFFLRDSNVFLECEYDRTVDGFGEASLIVGRVIAARVRRGALIVSGQDPREVLRAAPLLAYIAPGHYSEIDGGDAFPFPQGFRR